MAGGKLSPRQKMINMMYLVLLALLAMQVSVEVMNAFNKIYERSERSIEKSIDKNEHALSALETMSNENPKGFKMLHEKGEKVHEISENINKAINVLKNKIKELHPEDEQGDLPATNMGKGDAMDEYLFIGDKYQPAGDDFIAAVDTYRNEILKVLGSGHKDIEEAIKDGFNTDPVKSHGVTKKWLEYNFKGLPTIGTIAILSSMENSVLNIENEIINTFLTGRLKEASSASQLQAFVQLNKNTYSPGDEVEAKIFLASKDDSKVPNEVEFNGKKLDLSKVLKGGKVIHKFKASSVGDKDIVGKFVFLEDGKTVEVPIESNYCVVAGSNQAIVSADRMNVVYRGLDNPMTISMAGISPTKLKATAAGSTISGRGASYMLKPGKGKTVSINVTGTTDSGETIKSPAVEFRIKDIPQAMASIRGEYGAVKMPKSSLGKSTVTAGLPDFVFDLDLKVSSFKVKVPGKNTVTVNGGRMNSQAQKAISGAKRGDIVTIFGIKATMVGNSSYRLKEVLPISVEISN